MPIVITPIFIGLFVIVQVPLTLIVGMRRVQTGIRFFGGDDDVLLRRMRAHGNYTETVPIALLAMGCAEVLGMPSAALWVGGGFLAAGRIAHATEILRSGWGPGRSGGMVLTFLAMLEFGAWSLWRSLFQI
ncbi:MAPEG family protein [Allomesorhizobium camelthorni]|uniref:MAPEG family protein n=1 Tax=Allomesorhizobium camelthorni TaxID=475069 RepID=UPI001981B01F|nr:MAPEG family protein [Mesorhizobium camelthorni]